MELGVILQCEFNRRRAGNRRYTLRAFARFLGVDHSSLSQILRGTRRAGMKTLATIGRRLGLEPQQLASCRAVETDRAVAHAIRRPDFRPSSRWLAVRAGISVDEVNVSLQRLLRRGVLRMVSRELWCIEEAAFGESRHAVADR
ncbi:MAG TPA: helix-turn-helix transcriptional regulator, partial [Thermoanaerobaculia bacterium]|nr:helix-turn-helix transcriptional regulator [Thermoanaerobaculia bacterium]